MKVVHPTMDEINAIYNLIQDYSQHGIILKRSLDEIANNINNFFIIKLNNQVISCVSIFIYSKNLAELRTLVVDKKHFKKGCGRLLVQHVVKLVQRLKIEKLFTLTLENDFFKKMNFQEIEKNSLPEKIFKDCLTCSAYQKNCNETAFVYNF